MITPSFNSARFIEESLDSVAALVTPHEHLVMDGGSKDGTVDLLRRRRDPALTWISEADRGQTHAVNKGLQLASGELVAWLNSDDAYVVDNLDRAIAQLFADPAADAMFGFMEIVDEAGRYLKRYRCGPFSWHRYLYLGDYLPTPTIVFRRSLLERAPGLDEEYADAADYDFYLRLLRGARVRRFPHPLVRFRYHSASKTASNVGLQQREALAIRLSHARNRPERSLIRALNHVVRFKNAARSSWPDLSPRD